MDNSGASVPDRALVNDAPAGHRPSGFDPSRGDVILTKDVFDFLMGIAPYDGVWFHELNANLPGRFWWRAILQSAQLGTAQAIEARSDATGTGAAEGESAVPEGCAQDTRP